jgi:hypothetical protein
MTTPQLGRALHHVVLSHTLPQSHFLQDKIHLQAWCKSLCSKFLLDRLVEEMSPTDILTSKSCCFV